MFYQYTLFYYLKSHYYVQLMQFIFVHQNFPGQFRHITKTLAMVDYLTNNDGQGEVL